MPQFGCLSEHNQVKVLQDGDECFMEMWRAIDSARRRVWVEIYTLDNSNVARITLQKLLSAAARGVEVVLLYDAFGSFDINSDMVQHLREASGVVLPFNPMWPLTHKLGPFLFRDHRKARRCCVARARAPAHCGRLATQVIVTDDIAFVGSRNISDDYAGPVFGTGGYHDTHIALAGPCVRHVSRAFVESVCDALSSPFLPNAAHLKQQLATFLQARGNAPATDVPTLGSMLQQSVLDRMAGTARRVAQLSASMSNTARAAAAAAAAEEAAAAQKEPAKAGEGSPAAPATAAAAPEAAATVAGAAGTAERSRFAAPTPATPPTSAAPTSPAEGHGDLPADPAAGADAAGDEDAADGGDDAGDDGSRRRGTIRQRLSSQVKGSVARLERRMNDVSVRLAEAAAARRARHREREEAEAARARAEAEEEARLLAAAAARAEHGDAYVQLLQSNSRRDMWHIQKALRVILQQAAAKRCYVTNPYFLPSARLRRAIARAARRGVDVRIITTGVSPLPMSPIFRPLMRAAHQHVYGTLLKHGVRVFEMHGRSLHAKNVTVDGVYSVVGSFNLDRWSDERNMEVTASVFDAHTARELERVFVEDMGSCHEITLAEWKQRPLLLRALYWVAYHCVVVSSGGWLSPHLKVRSDRGRALFDDHVADEHLLQMYQ